MRRFKLMRKRLVKLVAVTALALGAGAGVAVAAFPDTNVETYTGCLNIGGTSGGQVGQIAVGLNPLKPCGANQKLVHLGGGDITKVTAGAGLSGGGDNGAVTLSLDGAHSLPQDCQQNQVPKSNGSNAWNCGNDNDTTYAADEKTLNLSGSTFSVDPDYRVKNNKSCGTGNFATGIDSSGDLTCDAPTNATTGYSATGDFHALAGTETIISKDLPAGNYVLFARVSVAYFSNQGANEKGYGQCAIPGDAAGVDLADLVGQGVVALTSTVAHPGGAVALTCTEVAGDFQVLSAHLTAVKVDSLG